MNMYLYMGSQAIGAVNLAERIENWDPEHQAKLRQVGLRSSFELDDEEGHVFIALSADRYPIGLLCKMEQVKGVAPRADKIQEIWEAENWGEDEWAEQALAEIAFAKAMNVQYVPERDNLYGNVAGYRVRRAPNGLVLVPSDNDEDIFVAVMVERTKARACVLGWFRGSEGKLSQFYQNNCWVIPPETLHDMEELPGKKQLRAMPPY